MQTDGIRNQVFPTISDMRLADKHPGKIERDISVVKERSSCLYHALLCDQHTRLMTCSLLREIVDSINSFSSKDRVLDTPILRTIVEGKPNPDFNQKRIVLGLYAMVHIGTTNTLKARFVLVRSLNVSNNRGVILS